MSDEEFVERPTHRMGAKRRHRYIPLLETADNGKALRIALNGKSAAQTQNSLRNLLRRHGFRLRYEDTKDGHITAWAEHITPNGHEPK